MSSVCHVIMLQVVSVKMCFMNTESAKTIKPIYNLIFYLTVYLYMHFIFLAVRIGIIYLISGFGGSILSSLFIRNNISVGASGALFGLLGAMLSELLTNWSMYTNKVSYVLFSSPLYTTQF